MSRIETSNREGTPEAAFVRQLLDIKNDYRMLMSLGVRRKEVSHG